MPLEVPLTESSSPSSDLTRGILSHNFRKEKKNKNNENKTED